MDTSTTAFPIARCNARRMARAQQVLVDNGIIDVLAAFTPVLAGTIPLGISTTSSDLDVLCEVYNHEQFCVLLQESFSLYRDFSLYSALVNDRATTVCNFFCADFPVEVFGQSLPVEQQYAFRHMVVEAKLLDYTGVNAERAICDMKRQGIPTEVAFGVYFALQGNSYQALADLYDASDELLHSIAARSLSR